LLGLYASGAQLGIEINNSSVCSEVLNCNIVFMSVLNFCLAYMQLVEHTNYVVQYPDFKGKKDKETDFAQVATESCLKLVYILTCLQSILQAFLYR